MYKETLKIMMTTKMKTLLSKTEKKAIIERFYSLIKFNMKKKTMKI